jgi:hypothetical protein
MDGLAVESVSLPDVVAYVVSIAIVIFLWLH